MRAEYAPPGPFNEQALAPDPVTQFGYWFAEAVATGVPEPNAMIVSTADAAGRPSSRTVLLKQYDQAGFTFFTNYDSRKGVELAANPYASLLFPWFPVLHRQVIVSGPVERVDAAESAEYFASRPRGSQIGAWASRQSSPVADRAELAAAYAEAEERYPGEVPVPPYWGGLRVVPDRVEFWQGQPNRMHDRLVYQRDGAGWVVERLMP